MIQNAPEEHLHSMGDNQTDKLVEQQDWLGSMGEKSDAFVHRTLGSAGSTGEAAKEVLVNSRLLGHKRHPTITDVPLGSWTVTVVSDILDLFGVQQTGSTQDISLAVGMVASLLASAGGLADLSETQEETDRRLGLAHGMLQGVTMLLFGGSWIARRARSRNTGRLLSFLGYGTLLTASYLAAELAQRRRTTSE